MGCLFCPPSEEGFSYQSYTDKWAEPSDIPALLGNFLRTPRNGEELSYYPLEHQRRAICP